LQFPAVEQAPPGSISAASCSPRDGIPPCPPAAWPPVPPAGARASPPPAPQLTLATLASASAHTNASACPRPAAVMIDPETLDIARTRFRDPCVRRAEARAEAGAQDL
jgi:hypothetical protein